MLQSKRVVTAKTPLLNYDTITHAFGALIAKASALETACFREAMTAHESLTWVLMLGAIFPDSDVLRDISLATTCCDHLDRVLRTLC